MKCQEVQSLIDDYLDGLLNRGQAETITAHCTNCSECADAMSQNRQLRQLLKSAAVPPPSTGFVDRALRHAVQQNGPIHRGPMHHDSHRQGFIKGFGSALAAGLAIWAVVSLFPSQQGTETQTPMQRVAQNQTNNQANDNAISITLHEATSIKLAFHTAQAVEGATITINLSDNLELVGYQNRQTLEWKTNLLAGDNVLTLPIKALQLQQGKIIAQVSHNNVKKFIELKLDVKNNSDIQKPVSKNHIITTPVA
ncbi:zf-HC2 domain-containing protein [Kaarinaea lacus]